jgi:hypothetical protein
MKMSEINNTPEVEFQIEVANTVQTPVDDTLSIEGMAADAKATGEAIDAAKAELQEEIDAIDADIDSVYGNLFPIGSIYVSTSATAPTFGASNWQWQEIMMPVTYGDLMSGARNYAAVGSDDPGTIHFWMRINNAEVSA